MKRWYDLKEALSWYSTRIFLLMTMAPLFWAQIPAEVKAVIPPQYLPYIVAMVSLLGFIGRLRIQKPAP